MVLGKGTEQLSVYLSKPRAAQLKALGEHYRWNPSQTVSELLLFYGRLQAWASAYGVFTDVNLEGESFILKGMRDADTGEVSWEDLDECDINKDFGELIGELRKGLLAAFRRPMNHEEDL